MLAGKVLSVLAAVLFVATVIGVLAAPAIISLSASGFAQDPEKFAPPVTRRRISFPYTPLLSPVPSGAGVALSWGPGVC